MCLIYQTDNNSGCNVYDNMGLQGNSLTPTINYIVLYRDNNIAPYPSNNIALCQ